MVYRQELPPVRSSVGWYSPGMSPALNWIVSRPGLVLPPWAEAAKPASRSADGAADDLVDRRIELAVAMGVLHQQARGIPDSRPMMTKGTKLAADDSLFVGAE